MDHIIIDYTSTCIAVIHLPHCLSLNFYPVQIMKPVYEVFMETSLQRAAVLAAERAAASTLSSPHANGKAKHSWYESLYSVKIFHVSLFIM